MKTKNLLALLIAALTATSCSAATRQLPADTTKGLSLTLTQVWERTELYNKNIQIRQLHIESSIEEIKDAKAERLPDIEATGEYARISNMPLYENGVFQAPTQFEVLHTYYKVCNTSN